MTAPDRFGQTGMNVGAVRAFDSFPTPRTDAYRPTCPGEVLTVFPSLRYAVTSGNERSKGTV
jgi:hypothetical protein